MRLTVETGPLAGTTLALDRDRPTRIGSGADCELRIQEPGVQAEHAVVKALRDHGYGVKALAAGLRVNGAEVEAAPLTDGDFLEVGTTRISYGRDQAGDTPQIPGFKILGKLGTGGQGVVYRAEQVSLHREVALKVLAPKLTADPEFIATFVAEARSAAKLQHPNVVHVFDVGHHGETYYYTMEVMSHGSLETWLRQHGRMPVDRALRVIADAAAGLAYAESLRVVHRDIKPDNLMLDKHGTVKIADLGLARSADDSDEKLTGTPHFMAPEQVLRKGSDHRTDLYALGCTFFRLVTGRTPFRGKTVKDILRAQVKETPEPAHKIESSVRAEVSTIIGRLLEKEPDDRYQSATELLADLEPLLQPPTRKGLWISLVGVAVIIATGAIWWAINKKGEKEIVERFRDNPEAQRLAVENEQLKAQAREDQATIALLRARTSGLVDLELAAMLDQVAAAHQDTAAAGEAQQLAAATRSAVTQRQEQSRRREQNATAAVERLEQQVGAALTAGNLPLALDIVATAVTPQDADLPLWQRGRDEQHARVLAAAQQRLDGLRQAIETAGAAGDLSTLDRSAATLTTMLTGADAWPDKLLGDRTAVAALLERARAARTDAAAAAVAAQWRSYEELLRPQGAVTTALLRLDCAAAAAQLQTFAQDAGSSSPAAQALELAAAATHAAGFVEAFTAAIGTGTVQFSADDEGAENVTAWDRATGNLTLTTTGRRPTERKVDVAALAPTQWAALAGQVQGAAPGSRESFLAFATLQAHIAAARTYLDKLSRSDDATGIGEQAYPLASDVFEALLDELPPGDQPWITGLRRELGAATLLVGGLRALSERRNLAAATNLDGLLAEHAHTLAVLALP